MWCGAPALGGCSKSAMRAPWKPASCPTSPVRGGPHGGERVRSRFQAVPFCLLGRVRRTGDHRACVRRRGPLGCGHNFGRHFLRCSSCRNRRRNRRTDGHRRRCADLHGRGLRGRWRGGVGGEWGTEEYCVRGDGVVRAEHGRRRGGTAEIRSGLVDLGSEPGRGRVQCHPRPDHPVHLLDSNSVSDRVADAHGRTAGIGPLRHDPRHLNRSFATDGPRHGAVGKSQLHRGAGPACRTTCRNGSSTGPSVRTRKLWSTP